MQYALLGIGLLNLAATCFIGYNLYETKKTVKVTVDQAEVKYEGAKAALARFAAEVEKLA